METPKFPAKIDFNLHWKSSGLQTVTETLDFGPDFLFSFLNGRSQLGRFFKPGRPLPPDTRGDTVDPRY